MNNRQVKIGAIFSYILIIANALWGFIVTPFILRMLGTSSYGVYKTISSLTSSMMVLDFGLGGTVMRYVAKYRVDCENEKIEPFISMVICEAFILIVLITVISFAFYFNIDEIYGNSFIESEIILARQIFLYQRLEWWHIL